MGGVWPFIGGVEILGVYQVLDGVDKHTIHLIEVS